ncbi:MAG TPA: hypothetical protein DCW71_04175 [Alistipes sp.]|nr:hypothetical protein [Alistipes sp.]
MAREPDDTEACAGAGIGAGLERGPERASDAAGSGDGRFGPPDGCRKRAGFGLSDGGHASFAETALRTGTEKFESE